MQPGDVRATCADYEDLRKAIGFSPSTAIEDGIRCFVAWYREHYSVRANEEQSKCRPFTRPDPMTQ